MLITVGICTYNRAGSLRRTLDSLARLEIPDDIDWEVVIANNNSTDHTNEVIDKYRDRLPVRREFEPRPGKSNALNRAIDSAKGEYILWTDDDVVVDPGWLRAYVEAFRRWPEAAVFGGRIRPRYEAPVAKWVTESEAVLGGPYAIRDFGENVQPLSINEQDRLPYGANFAIRAKEQRAFRYDPNLGPTPGRVRVQEEFDIIYRLLASGATGYWIPEAKVEHCIGRDRQTPRYIANYYAGLGETNGLGSIPDAGATASWFGVPRRLWLRLLKRCVLYYCHRLLSPAPVWVASLQGYAYHRGIVRYCRQKRECLSGAVHQQNR
jgi:glucosyl-dolichyl phosphate glucuronosyltransferase